MPCRWKKQGFSSGEDCISKMTGKVDDPKAFCYGPAEAMQKEWDECIAENKDKPDPETHCANVLGIPIIHTGFEHERHESMRHSDFDKIYMQFMTHIKDEEEAKRRYVDWIQALSLDETRPYGQSMREQFRWIKRHADLQFWKEDANAKYWRFEAGFPLESMNHNVYTTEELRLAARSLIGKPVNINHKFTLRGVEIIAAEFEDDIVEGVLRIPKGLRCPVCDKDKTLNELVEQKGIVNNSLEAGCSYGTGPHGECEGMYFTGLSLLMKNVLPGIPLTRMLPLEQIMVEALRVDETKGKQNRRKRKVTRIKMEVLEQEPEKDEHGCIIGKQKWDGEKCVAISPEEQARSDAERAKAHFNISDEDWNKLSDEEKQAYIDKLPERGSAEQVATVDITPDTGPGQRQLKPKSVQPDEHGQCPEGYILSTALGNCILDESCPEGQHFDQDEQKCMPDIVPKPETPETAVGTPAAPREDVLTDAPTEVPTAGEQPPVTGTKKIGPMPPSGEPAPEAPTTLPTPVTPEKEPAPEPHTCTEPDHHWDADLNMCVPDEPITEAALQLSQAKVDKITAETALKTVEQQRDIWKNSCQKSIAKTLEQQVKIKTLEERITKLENLRNEAQRNFLNEQTRKEEAISKHRTEIANREEYREQAEQWKKTHENISRKYHAALATNLELSKKLTQANEDYLTVASKCERLEAQLNKAKSISKKIYKLRV